MAKNEEGEFELILGNRQLLSVFFITVVLLGLCFLMGYVVGRSTAPTLAGNDAPEASEPLPGEPSPIEVSPAGPGDSPEEPETISQATPPPEPEPVAPPAATPAKTAPQQPPPTPPKAEPPKAAPVKTAPAVASGAAISQPAPGRAYLQLSATGRDEAELMVERLRANNFGSIAAQIPENPALYRVLVGPMDDDAALISQTRASLNGAGFPGTDAFKRVY